LLLNPWLLWQYLHNMIGAVVTAASPWRRWARFTCLVKREEPYGQTFVRVGVIAGVARPS
jgi:cytochrome d ubiquinol oxidase subunit I